MQSTVKDRLKDFLAYNKIGQKTFAEIAGLSAGFVNAIRVSIQPKTLEKISVAFPDLNISWLLTGEGEMIKSSERVDVGPVPEPDTSMRMIPLINLDVRGGFNFALEQAGEFVEKMIPWENAHEGDFAVTTSGTSMMPVILPGSLILLRKVEGWREFIEYNILYVLELEDERRLLKLVQKSESPKSFTLISYNPNNPPQDISTDFISRIFKVVSIRTNYGF